MSIVERGGVGWVLNVTTECNRVRNRRKEGELRVSVEGLGLLKYYHHTFVLRNTMWQMNKFRLWIG